MPGETESPIPEPVKNPSPEVDDPEKRRRLVGPLKRLFGGFRSVQTEIIQTPISRRTVLKAGIAATILTGLGIGIREAKKWFDPTGKLDNFKTGGVETSSNEPELHHQWTVSDKVVIDSPAGIKVVDSKPIFKPVVDKEGRQLGEVMEVSTLAKPGDKEVSLVFALKKNQDGNYSVLTSGWQSWSSSVAVGKYTDELVGMKTVEKSLGGRTAPFIEPGQGNEQIPDKEGRSYGWICFRNMQDGQSIENIALGVIPGFEGLESIRYRQEGDSIVVSVIKNLEGVSLTRPVTFKVFLGNGDPRQEAGSARVQYADLLMTFSKELSKLAGKIPLMENRVIGFSWPAFGPGITQAIIQKEIEAGEGIIDTYIIDGGWEDGDGSFRANNKFSNLRVLADEMKKRRIKPGIWTCPFRAEERGTGNIPKEWFMKDAEGKPLHIKLPMPVGLLERYVAKTLALDISVSEVREYLADRYLELAEMGYEVFKADYLAVPFTGKLQNQDKTAVEYYRQTFEGIRQRIRDKLGKEIEIIGCGAPMMESIGLFNGMRITADSAMPNPEGMPIVGRIVPLLKKIPPVVQEYTKANTDMYRDTVAVAARRTLLFRGAHGLILDGVHIADEDIPLDPDHKERKNISLLALNRLGIGNLFVGDSLDGVGEQGRQTWKKFLNRFKMGNADIPGKYKNLPKIKEKYVTPKAT